MSRENTSSWVRQLRYRAKKHNLFNDLNIQEIHDVIDYYAEKCCFCPNDFSQLDTCFPLKENAPNIQANIIPLCAECKAKRKNYDLLEMVTNGIISKSQFEELLRACFKRNHGDVFKTYVKALSGYIDD